MLSNLIIPPWAKIAVPIAIVIVIFFTGWKVHSWKVSGKMEKLKAENEEFEKEASKNRALELQWRQKLMGVTAELKAKEHAYDLLEEEYLEAVNRTPEVVIEYRDRVRTVTETIVSEDCVGGLGELFDFIADLPERPQ